MEKSWEKSTKKKKKNFEVFLKQCRKNLYIFYKGFDLTTYVEYKIQRQTTTFRNVHPITHEKHEISEIEKLNFAYSYMYIFHKIFEQDSLEIPPCSVLKMQYFVFSILMVFSVIINTTNFGLLPLFCLSKNKSAPQ